MTSVLKGRRENNEEDMISLKDWMWGCGKEGR